MNATILVRILSGFLCLFALSCSKQSPRNNNTGGAGGNGNGGATDTIGQSVQLWGVTIVGGTNDSGTIYTLHGDGSGFQSAYSFGSAAGNSPYGGLCKAPNGKLYGIAQGGGKYMQGSIYSFNPTGNVFNKVADLGIDPATFAYVGTTSLGSFVSARDGNLYGCPGNIVRLEPGTDKVTAIGDHIVKSESLSLGQDGLLYGFGSFLPQNGASLGFELFGFDPKGNTLSPLYNLTNSTPATNAFGSLCQASDGNFYGLSEFSALTGPDSALPCIFRIDGSSHALTKLFTFTSSTGLVSLIQVNGRLIQSGDKLYGVTYARGNIGSHEFPGIFSYSLSTGNFTIEHTFTTQEGAGGIAGLTKASNGLLYGTNSVGGAGFGGTIFRFDPATDSCTVIHSFTALDKNGSEPSGNLIQY